MEILCREILCFEMQDARLVETRQSLRPTRPEHQQRQRQDQQFEEGENFDYYVDRKTGWRYYGEPRRNPPAPSSSSASQWSKLHCGRRVGAHGIPHQLTNDGDFGFLSENPENRRGVCRQVSHSQYTSVQYSLFTSTERPHIALGLRIALSSWCSWKESSHLVFSMSHPWLSHLLLTTSTSTSSFALPSMTHKHAAPSVQPEQLREHPVHHAHSLSRQVAPSRITLARRLAEWRKPAHNNSHKLQKHVRIQDFCWS